MSLGPNPTRRSSLARRPHRGLGVSILCLGFGLSGCAIAPPERPFSVEVEGAVISQSRNDAAVPGDTGTRFALDEVTGSGPFVGGRVMLSWRAAQQHEWRALIAPLTISGDDALEKPVSFDGQSFAAGAETDATYRFDSYRLTYRYTFFDSAEWTWRIGLTGKVRDAEIELEQGAIRGRKTDTGFVPLLHCAGDWRLSPEFRLAFDLDGSWAPQGRAFDAAWKGYWALGEGVELGFGYRTIEGGADNDEVLTFAWIHQAVVSLRFEF